MAAYIDLNPVRAGLVEDPKGCRYCGHAEAVAGNQTAERGLELVWKDYTNGAILGSTDFVRGFADLWQIEKCRKYPPKANPLKGHDWGDLSVIRGLRRQVFS